MAFREIKGYTSTAIGNGDFSLNHPRQVIRDEYTGEQRPERTWTVDRLLDYEDMGTIEFGEKSAIQIARALGYVSKHWHEYNKAQLAEAREERDEAVAALAKQKHANEVLLEQLSDYMKWADTTPSDEDVL